MTRAATAASRTPWGTRLIYAAAGLSLGHHLDHVVRGNHTGWPITEQVTPFTYSLAVYPLILLGLYLSRTGRVGSGYWLLLSGPGTLFLMAIHLGPVALEPPSHIIGEYPHRLLGWAAFGWLLALIAVLAAAFCYEVRQWRRQRVDGLRPAQDDSRSATPGRSLDSYRAV